MKSARFQCIESSRQKKAECGKIENKTGNTRQKKTRDEEGRGESEVKEEEKEEEDGGLANEESVCVRVRWMSRK